MFGGDELERWFFLDLACPVVRVSVVGSRGSVPRGRGSFMVIYESGGNLCRRGTIGGGALELEAESEALSLLGSGIDGGWHRLYRRVVLAEDLRQSCGGQVELLYEYFGDIEKSVYRSLLASAGGTGAGSGAGSAGSSIGSSSGSYICVSYDSGSEAFLGSVVVLEGVYCQVIADDLDILYLFGAGHVGCSVVYHMVGLSFRVRWYDFVGGRFPSGVGGMCESSGVIGDISDIVMDIPLGCYYLVMTHSHAVDYSVVGGLLGGIDFHFLGLIGSRAKALSFRSGLRGDGFGDDLVARVVSPLGLVVGGDNSPSAIAVSSVAQLLQVRSEVRACK